MIGLGNSGADISVDVCNQAKSTSLSTRSGAWIVSRTFEVDQVQKGSLCLPKLFLYLVVSVSLITVSPFVKISIQAEGDMQIIFQDGLPADMTVTTRFLAFIRTFVPLVIGNWIFRKLLSTRVNHDRLGVRSRQVVHLVFLST